MENLIDHLERALDEEECVKDVLLLLKHTNPCKNDSAADGGFSRLMVEQLEDSLFLTEPFHCRYAFPAKVVIATLNIDDEILTRCKQSQFSWSTNFLQCYLQVLDIAKAMYERNAGICDQIRQLQSDASSTTDESAFLRGQLSGYLRCLPSKALTLGSTEQPLVTTIININTTEDSEHCYIKLAPLVEEQRSIKHYIVPLMEPDIQTSFDSAIFVPSIGIRILSKVNSELKHNSTKKTPARPVDNQDTIDVVVSAAKKRRRHAPT